jgi:DegV family protein with EDD domain
VPPFGGRVAVVTDSTSYLPRSLAARHPVRVVPVAVVVGDDVHLEGRDLDGAGLVAKLAAGVSVTTSRPAPESFSAAYEAAWASGAQGVVSVHLSSRLSGTAESALMAARDARLPVTVVDSRTLGMGLGFAVLDAAAAAAGGASATTVADVARRRSRASSVFFQVDSLEHLRRGGRIGPAAALLGSALSVKPLLHVDDGRIALLDKVRTATKATARMIEHAIAAAEESEEIVDVVVHHLGEPDRARTLADQLSVRIPRPGTIMISEVGAVVAAHVGPGLLAVVIAPRTPLAG